MDSAYEASDGTALPIRVWPGALADPDASGPEAPAPTDRPRAALVYLHGIQSHSGWYEGSSRRLAEAGVCVYQVERRGSGRDTAHERGHVDRAETWLEDVAAAAERARSETKVERVHLMGVSWGGKLALASSAHRPDLYRSLIMASPGIFPIVDVAAMTKVRVAMCLAAGRPLRRFPIPLSDPHLFTENPKRVRYIAEDPLSLREVTARFMYESRRLDRMARRAARTARSPVFLALAEADRITDNAATRALVETMPAARKQIVTYAGAHHTLEFEPDPEAYFKDLVAWVDDVERAEPNA